MKDSRDAVKNDKASKSSSVSSLPLILDVDDFKGDFSFDALFGNLVNELLPSFQDEETYSSEGHGSGVGGNDALSNGHLRGDAAKSAAPLFPEVDKLLALFKDSYKELVDLRTQVDGRLYNLKKEVSVQDSKHRKTLAELEKGVDGLFDSFARLDSRISSVGQTAAKIGDHLQSADAQRETASQTIELIKYLMEFNGSPGDLMELSPLFSDDSRVAEAASIAQKLRSFAEEDIGRQGIGAPPVMGNAAASRGLEVAVANLQDYCNELENRLLARFDAASQRRELPSMAECAKILSQFNRGTSAMQHYVATRPMFIDVEVMNADTRLVLGDQGAQASPSNVARGLSSLYKEITDTVRKEAATIMAVFPSPNEVMSILVQRVLEQRVTALLDKLLVKPSLVNLPPMEEGGLLLYLRMLAVAYEKTQELARDLRSVGCGDLDVEGLTESLFSAHKDEYPEQEQASLRQLYHAKMEELRAESQQISESTGTIGRSKGASVASSHQQISVTVVTEFVRWNEEAISRCTLFSSQPATLATNVRAVFTCLLDQVSQYITEGLERSREGLTEAANLRDRFTLGTSVSRRVAAAAASAAEAAATAGESSFRSFMVAVQRCGSSVAIVQQNFANSISRLLLPVDGAHAASCEEMATAMSSAETAAYKGLQQCIETVMAEVERLLSAEQKSTDYRSPDDGIAPDHRPTNACTRVVAYLSRVLESAFTALEGLNKQAFLTELGNRLHKGLLNAQPTISNLSGEVTELRCSEKSAEVAENNVKIPDSDDIRRGCEHIRKRKRALDSVESIKNLYSKGRKLHMKLEEKLSSLHSMLGRQLDNPMEEGRCLASNLQCLPHAKHDGLHKKRKKVSNEDLIPKHVCEVDERKNTEKVETEVHEDASDLETMGSFEDVADGDYMKLLDLDNAADEERYRMAMKMPLSPTLPNINFHSDEIVDVDNSEALLEKWANEGLSTDKESLLPMQSFRVIDFENNFNRLKHNVLGTSHNLLLHKNVGPVIGNGCSTTEAGKTSSHQIWDSGLVVGMSNSPISRDEEVKFPLESVLGSTHDIIPKYCVVFPNMRDCSIISRIFGAVKTCIARCCLLSQTEWVVQKILLALKMEQNLLLMEKVCVFFTLLLLNLSVAAPMKFGKYMDRDSTLCLDSFSQYIRAVMSDVEETRSEFEDFGFLDALLSLIEEFLIDGRVMVYNNTSSETFITCDSRIDFILDDVNIMLLYEVASANLLVSGSIILASICAAVNQIGIICEASYNIFRRHASDSSLVLTIIHVFAYMGGQKFFSLSNYGLMMTVLKSLVLLLEGVNLSGNAASCPSFVSEVQIQFHPCAKCPFSEGAVSVDTATSLLIELLQNYAALGTTNIDVIKSFNSLNSRVLFDNSQSEQGLNHEGVHYVADMNCDASCCLDKYDTPTTQSDSVVDMTLCRLSDVLSLVELLACSMSWEWTCIKVVPQLLKILESCVLENFAAAIIVLLGQLGRLGVDAGGYEDKGVESLRCNLSVFLSRDATRKAGLPIQIATVTALLGLVPPDFETLVQRNVKIQATASQSVLADSVRKWFSLLSKEQQDLSLKLLQTAGAKKK